MAQRDDLNLRLLDLARFHIGVTERGGNNCGPMVELFQKAVDGKAEREPWCMCFMQYCIKTVEQVHGGRSRVLKSEHCTTTWMRSEPGARLVANPQPGDLVIWKHGTAPVEKLPPGHVGVVAEVHDDHIVTVEGNTAPGAGIVREGDGVYLRRRACTRAGHVIGDMVLVGFLRVFG